MRDFSFLIVTVIFGTLLTSCKKNYDNQREFTVSLLDTIFVSHYNSSNNRNYQTRHIYYYGCQNRITGRGIHSYSPDWGSWWLDTGYSLYYNANGDTVKYTSCETLARCYRTTFSKKGNKVNISIRYHPTVTLFGSVNGELELNVQGLPVKLTYEKVEDWGTDFITNRSTYTIVTLTWQNENLTKTNWESETETETKFWWEEEWKFEKSSSTGTVAYTHDDKKTPFYHCNTPKWALWLFYYFGRDANYGYNKNNVKNVTMEDGNTVTYEYTYNDDGLPITRTWSDETITYTETYIYNAAGSASNEVCTLEGYW